MQCKWPVASDRSALWTIWVLTDTIWSICTWSPSHLCLLLIDLLACKGAALILVNISLLHAFHLLTRVIDRFACCYHLGPPL